MNAVMRNWADYWAQPNSIYVNERHSAVHYRDIADGTIALLPSRNARVLDYGSGEATDAARVAAAAAELTLCEASPWVRSRLTERFGDHPKIKIAAPEDLQLKPDGSVDLIIANSLVQYVAKTELGLLLATWRRLLDPKGVLVVSDIIPPHVGVLSDALALLRYAGRNGFLLAALAGLMRTALSPYRKLRGELGIATYEEAEFVARLDAAGFAAERLGSNLEHNPERMTFLARPRD
jgi:ubiquinone/menaquinone biosynthesis C-methylase UbiE